MFTCIVALNKSHPLPVDLYNGLSRKVRNFNSNSGWSFAMQFAIKNTLQWPSGQKSNKNKQMTVYP